MNDKMTDDAHDKYTCQTQPLIQAWNNLSCTIRDRSLKYAHMVLAFLLTDLTGENFETKGR